MSSVSNKCQHVHIKDDPLWYRKSKLPKIVNKIAKENVLWKHLWQKEKTNFSSLENQMLDFEMMNKHK